MAQNQVTITLNLLDGSARLAVATGNNAAWLCPCDYSLPLLGYSSASDRNVVECKACGRLYRVVPEGNVNRKKAIAVDEVQVSENDD